MDHFSLFRRRATEFSPKYRLYRSVCLAGIVLLALLGAQQFPALYENGLSDTDWMTIGSVLLSAIILFYLERACVSRSGDHTHDWHTAGGSLHAFSFDRRICKKCGARRILVAVPGENGDPSFPAPGHPSPQDWSMRFWCPVCRDCVPEGTCVRKPFASSRVSPAKMAELGISPKGLRSYRLNRTYIQKYSLVTVLMLMALSSSLYFARTTPIRLLLPLIAGYLFFVSLYNLLTSAATRYWVTSKGVLSRSLWGYSFYAVADFTAFVTFSAGNAGGKSWGLFTDKENLTISPIVVDATQMAAEVRSLCEKASVPLL